MQSNSVSSKSPSSRDLQNQNRERFSQWLSRYPDGYGRTVFDCFELAVVEGIVDVSAYKPTNEGPGHRTINEGRRFEWALGIQAKEFPSRFVVTQDGDLCMTRYREFCEVLNKVK